MGVFIAILVLLMAFSNCVRDSSTIVATVVSSRILSPKKVFLICSLFEFSGALFVGSAVASTIGQKIFTVAASESKDIVSLLISSILAAMIWGLVCWRRAWPTSNGQAIFAALLGSGLVLAGKHQVSFSTLFRVIAVLVSSPILGFLVASVLTRIVRTAGEWMTPRVSILMDRLHALSCFLVALAHGSNDGQIIMGLMILALGVGHVSGAIPMKVRLATAAVMALGVLMGGRRILRRGMSLYKTRAPQGFCSDMTAALIILACASTGFPASTVQVVTGSIIGSGSAQNPRAVKWHVAQNVAMSWFFTIPLVALLSAGLSVLLRPFLQGLS